GRDGLAALPDAGLVLVVVGVAARARLVRLLETERLGVALVAGELAVRAFQAEARPRLVVEVELLQRAELRRVAPLAGLGVEQVSLVRRHVAAGVAAVARSL